MKDRFLVLASNILVGVVGVVLILAGALKLIGIGAEDMVEGLEKARLIQHVSVISLTAIACGVLLLLPVTRKAGILAASAYWGGAIVAHMTYDDSVIMPACFQAILWIGARERLCRE